MQKAAAASMKDQLLYFMIIPWLLFEAGRCNTGRTAPAALTPGVLH